MKVLQNIYRAYKTNNYLLFCNLITEYGYLDFFEDIIKYKEKINLSLDDFNNFHKIYSELGFNWENLNN